MSTPAANALSLPVMTMQPISGSASKPSSARLSSLIRSAFSAFSACGRLSVMSPTLPSVVTMIVSYLEAGLMSCSLVSSLANMVRLVPLPLTVWTVEGRAAALDDAADGAAAAFLATGLSLPTVHFEGMLKAPEPAVGALVVAQRRASGLDRLSEHGLHRLDESVDRFRGLAGLSRERAGKPQRRDAGAKERLAGIDVAEPCDQALIDEGGLDRRRLALEPVAKPFRT